MGRSQGAKSSISASPGTCLTTCWFTSQTHQHTTCFKPFKVLGLGSPGKICLPHACLQETSQAAHSPAWCAGWIHGTGPSLDCVMQRPEAEFVCRDRHGQKRLWVLLPYQRTEHSKAPDDFCRVCSVRQNLDHQESPVQGMSIPHTVHKRLVCIAQKSRKCGN